MISESQSGWWRGGSCWWWWDGWTAGSLRAPPSHSFGGPTEGETLPPSKKRTGHAGRVSRIWVFYAASCTIMPAIRPVRNKETHFLASCDLYGRVEQEALPPKPLSINVNYEPCLVVIAAGDLTLRLFNNPADQFSLSPLLTFQNKP